MVYFIFLLITLIYSYRIGQLATHYRYSPSAQLFSYFPLIIVAVIICGGQYYVGTDYPSYIRFFNGSGLEHYVNTGEVGFVYSIKSLLYLGIRGNGIYAFFYFVGFLLLAFFIRGSRLPSQFIFLFLLLFIGFTGLFNNQLNVIRQAIAIYIGSMGALEIIKRKWMYGIFLIVISSTFHAAAIIYLIFLFSPLVEKLSNSMLYGLIILGGISGLVLSSDFLNIILPFLPPTYAWHIEGGAIGEREGLQIITKYIFIPLFIFSIKERKKYNLSTIHEKLFKWGIIGFSLKIGLLGLTIISRVSDYWLIFSIFPLFFYLVWLWKSNKQKKIYSHLLMLLIVGFYFIKTCVFPSFEYKYQSIYQFYF